VANVTSGSYVFDKNLSIDEIIEDAYERIGMQGVSGYQLKTAKRSLNILFSEWGNRGLQFWEVKNQNVKLVDGQAVYTFYRSPADGLSDGIATTLSRGINGTTAATHSTSDTVTQFPNGMTDIQEANYRVASTSVDTPMTKISRSQYQGFSNKTDKGLPSQYWVQRFIDKVTMTLYLTPGSYQAGNFINFYYTKRIDDVGAYTNATDVPYRFVPCMIAGLSYYLAIKYAPQRTQELKLLYEDELLRAEDEDGSSNSTYISPKIYYPGVS
jgi:hypothetical protein